MPPKPWLGWLGVFLTLLKPFYAGLIVLWIIRGDWAVASIGILCLMVSDIFDGIIFRMSPQIIQERLGFLRRVFDAVSDRLCIFLVLVVMIETTGFPFHLYIVEIVRETILVSIIGYSWIVCRAIKEPNLPSRIATFFVGITAICWLNLLTGMAIISICIVAFAGALGLWKYYHAMMAGTD